MLAAIRQWVIKTMMKNNTGVVQTLPKRDLIELNTQITAQRLMQSGIDPEALKNVNQVENAVNAIESRPPVQQGIKSTKSAKVFDLEGKEIKDPKNIMGGKEINQQTLNEELMKKDNPYSDLVKTTNQKPKTLKEREAEVLARMEKENKEAAQRIRDRKRLEDRAIEDFVDDAGGVNPDDPRGIDDFIPDPENMATGGRAGFANGTPELKLYPRASGRETEQEVGPGIKISERDLNYGITGLLEGDKFFGGAEIDKGKVKINVLSPEGDTLFKDTIGKKDAVNFILGMGDPKGEKFQIKTDKDFENMQLILNKKIDFNRLFRADGGRIGLLAGSGPKIFKLLKDPKKIKQAIDNIFPTGDVKYDATMAAESLVELNPKFFGNKLYDDLDSMTRLDIYDAVISPMMSAQAKALRMKKASKPTKTLEGIEKTGKINISDPEVAEEFARFMKETSPGDAKKLEQTLELDNFDPKGRKKNAQGGRIGLKEGSGMTRRSFLKILGGLAAIPIVGKFLKPIKTAKGIKSVPIIKTDNVAGKPEWFDALVNKVILEGDDVTKKFATQERQIVHSKDLGDGTTVRVTQDMDQGAVKVEYDSADNVFEDTVQMEYKKPLPDEGAPSPTAEFTTAESGPVGRVQGPDDFDIDVDEVGGTSIRDLDSDVSKLKEYATGKGPTMKEIIQNKRRRDKAKAITEDPEAQTDAVIRRQGDYDPSDYDDYASGGIARMLGE